MCLLVANLGLVVSEFAGIGAAFELFGVSRYLSIPIAAVVVWAVVVLGNYRYAERVFLLLGLAFIAYPIAAILGQPRLGARWAPTWSSPTSWRASEFLFLAVALIGTTVTPYMQLYQAAAVADRGSGPEEYRTVRIDTISGAIFANLVSMAIIIATAAAIGGTGPLTSAKQAAEALKPVAGAGAEVLFGIGLLGASALGRGRRAAVDLLRRRRGGRRGAVGVAHLPPGAAVHGPVHRAGRRSAPAVALLPGNLIALLINMQFLNGIITPIVLTFILILANRRSVLGEAVNGPRFQAVATVCVVVIAVLAAVVLLQSVAAWVGLV